MFIDILGYKIFNGNKVELLKLIREKKKVNIISGNPEVLYSGLNNEELLKSFNRDESIIIPDGIGTLIAAKITKKEIKQKIAGIEVMDELLKVANRDNISVYLLGATEETVKSCAETLKNKYKNLDICGMHNGFFDLDFCDEILNDIKSKDAKFLFVAMGCPRQEIFINKYMDVLNCDVFMGVGGSFDVIAGNVNRAPNWMISIGAEWLYRVLKEPYRIKRLESIPKFLFKVFKER